MKKQGLKIALLGALGIAALGSAVGAAPVVKTNVAVAASKMPKTEIRSNKVTVIEKDAYVNGLRVFRKGDFRYDGNASLETFNLSVKAETILFSPKNRVVYIGMGFNKPQAKVVGSLTPRTKQALPIRIEATCDVGTLKNGVWVLEGRVSGFYEDASGRHPLSGDIVKLSAFDNAISIVQDGAVSLSSAAEKPAS